MHVNQSSVPDDRAVSHLFKEIDQLIKQNTDPLSIFTKKLPAIDDSVASLVAREGDRPT